MPESERVAEAPDKSDTALFIAGGGDEANDRSLEGGNGAVGANPTGAAWFTAG